MKKLLLMATALLFACTADLFAQEAGTSPNNPISVCLNFSDIQLYESSKQQEKRLRFLGRPQFVRSVQERPV